LRSPIEPVRYVHRTGGNLAAIPSQQRVHLSPPAGPIVFVRNYDVPGEERGIQLATGPNAEIALNRALEAGIHKMFEDPAFLDAIVAASS